MSDFFAEALAVIFVIIFFIGLGVCFTSLKDTFLAREDRLRDKLTFNDNEAFFKYASQYLSTSIVLNKPIIGIIESPFDGVYPVMMGEYGTQRAVVRVCDDGHIVYVGASTKKAGGEMLRTGDLVAILPTRKQNIDQKINKGISPEWVTIITHTVKRELNSKTRKWTVLNSYID